MSNKIVRKISVPIILIILAVSPFFVQADVYINEIAWMGISGTNGQYGEWVELYNSSDQEINLVDWKLYRNGGLVEPDRIFTLTKSIQPKGYLVIERMTSSIPDPLLSINDEIGTFGGGNLANLPIGEYLVLKDNNESIIQSLDFSSGWPAGDNASKLTMQKISSGWITATGTPKTANDTQSSDQSSSSSSQGSSSSSSSSFSSNENIASGSVDYHYKNEHSAKAGEDKIAVAGADIVLEGKAYGFKKEPLENARYLWNLGDWSYKEGKNIRHIYKYPGNYIVTLEVSPRDGDVSASDRINIKVIPNELQIIDANDEFIKLKNKSDVILDVSGWFLKASGSFFKAPNGSLIRANSELIISSDVSGLKFADKKFSAEILYPNGSVAFSYLPSLSSSSKPKEIILSKPQPIMPAAATEAVAVSSSSHTDKITQIIQPAKPTTVVGFATTTQLASVITIGEKNNSGNKIWLILAVITGIIGGAGIFLARRNNQSSKN